MRVQPHYTFMLIPQPQAALAVAPVEEGCSSNTSTNSGSSSRARITFSVGSCAGPSTYLDPGPTGDRQTVLQGGVVQGGVLQGGVRQGGIVGAFWHSADVADPQHSAGPHNNRLPAPQVRVCIGIQNARPVRTQVICQQPVMLQLQAQRRRRECKINVKSRSQQKREN